jgi:AMP-binding enzyme
MNYFIKTFENSIKECWDKPALDDYKVSSLTYGELAAEIEAMHLVWKKAGLNCGDKISLNAGSCSNWAKVFMAATSGGYVAVQIFNGFTPADTQKMVNHSDSRILYTEKSTFAKMNFDEMPALLAAIDMKSGELLASRGTFADIYARSKEMFAEAYPDGLKKEDVCYPERSMDDLCCIMYTSGSTGTPKGVMLTVRNISSNVDLIPRYFPYRRGETYLSILPFAHIFGLLYDMVGCLSIGMHLTILCHPPIPKLFKEALCEINPTVIMMVPLVLNKMMEFTIGEFVHSKTGGGKLAEYKENPDFCEALRMIFMAATGKNCELVVTGGAALPSELEELLAIKLQVPLVTGYGMTECAPTITLGHLGKYKLKSTGEPVDCMHVRINSTDPEHIAGEVLIKGDNVFAGYYKNPDADKQVFTDDGWFRSGDLGMMDKDGTVFLVGRCKSMLLSTNGQNVFPEEIEVILNPMPYVSESLIVQRENKLVAIIVPNSDALANDNINREGLEKIMAGNIEKLNSEIPAYEAISEYELHFEPFAKTPKGSIKRFLYA